jgi:hypothetical protein
MNNPLFNLLLVIGGIFSAIAALMAYLITYNEYIHHYQRTEEPKKFALQAALLTFIVFFALTLGSGFIMSIFFI